MIITTIKILIATLCVKYTYKDVFKITKKEAWQVCYDPPKHRILNALSLSNGGLYWKVKREGSVKVHVKIQPYRSQISCLVTKLSDDLDLIMGDEWLNKHRARIKYDCEACILH